MTYESPFKPHGHDGPHHDMRFPLPEHLPFPLPEHLPPAELDRYALTCADSAFLHSRQTTLAQRVRDAIYAYLHAIEYGARYTDPSGARVYPSLVETIAAVGAWRAAEKCGACAELALGYGSGVRCAACRKRELDADRG